MKQKIKQEEAKKEEAKLVKQNQLRIAIMVIVFAGIGFFIGAFASIAIKNLSGEIPFITNTGFGGFIGMIVLGLIGFWINKDKSDEDDQEELVEEEPEEEESEDSEEKDIKEEDYF